MAVPKHSDMYNVFLDRLKDCKVHTLKEIKLEVINSFNLNKDDIAEMLPNGNKTMLDNRVGWCRTYLKKAILIESPQRGQFIITQRGLDLLEEDILINEKILMRYPEFIKFKNGENNKLQEKNDNDNLDEESTPQEVIEEAYKRLNEVLENELLDEMCHMDPYKFETLVVDLLVKMGYGKLAYDSKATKKSFDEGIDGIVTADKLGFDSIYIQAKRYKEGSIGRPEIQKFIGALSGQGAQKGAFITTSKFTKEAIEFAERNLNYKIVLIDGEKLSELMVEYELGVSTEYVYKIRKIDTDYFLED